MNLLDLVLAVIVGYCLIRGVFRGLVKELSSIIGVAGGFYAAYTYYPLLAGHLAHWIANPGYLNILSFLAIFTAVCIVVSIAGVVIKYLMNIAFLGWTDRLSGALFGTIKGVLITSVVILVLTAFLSSNAAIIEQSWVAQNTMRISALLVKVTPKEMKRSFGVRRKSLNTAWHQK